MAHIFISYRREDAGYVAGMLADRLRGAFGPDAVFMDVDTIPLGVDFRTHLSEAVSRCDVVLAIIGDGWFLRAADDSRRRIDDPTDFVRIELDAALARNIPVVPILVGNAEMPAPKDLPPPLEPLAFRNATELRAGRDMGHHLDALVRGLRVHLPAGPIIPAPATENVTTPRPAAAPSDPPTALPESQRPANANVKEWSAAYEDNSIQATVWWIIGQGGKLRAEADLYVNGRCVARADVSGGFLLGSASLRAKVKDRAGGDHLVEAQIGGFLNYKAKIFLDGRQISAP